MHEVSATFQETAIKESKKKLATAKRRREEVGALIKKLYESYAADKIPENHFTNLLKDYDTESVTLDGEIGQLQSEINVFNTESVKADKFIELTQKYTEFTTFSVTLLNEFIEKVIVHEAEKIDGKRIQKVDIHLNYIGKFEIPSWALPEELHQEVKISKRPYTEKDRKADRRYYAKKKAKRLAEEEKRRAEILAGTAYEVPTQEKEIEEIAS